MEIIDISWPITHDTTTYKDRGGVAFEYTKTFEKDGARESAVRLGAHTGTHVDAPAHFLQDGKTIDKVRLEQLIGPCLVIDCTDARDAVTACDVIDVTIEPNTIVLFKTRNSLLQPTEPFVYDFIYVHQEAADFLVKRKVKAVGIDYLGIERNQPGHATHVTLFNAHIPIIEGLRLGHVEPGQYTLCCLPLAMQGVEAAPARAVLWK